MAAANRRVFLIIILTAVVFRTGDGETERGEGKRVEHVQRCTAQMWVRFTTILWYTLSEDTLLVFKAGNIFFKVGKK